MAVYYLFPRAPSANYGTLLATAPIEGVEGTRPDGSPFRLDELRGRWVLIALSGVDCDPSCERRLYATRQARTMQGKEQDRIVRVVLLVEGREARPSERSPGLLAAAPGARRRARSRACGRKISGGDEVAVRRRPARQPRAVVAGRPDIKGIAGT
jgi:hypothetical protein